jgi:hypothetical protein
MAKNKIGASTIPYLFPGGRRAVIAAEQRKKARKAVKALLREMESIRSLETAEQ